MTKITFDNIEENSTSGSTQTTFKQVKKGAQKLTVVKVDEAVNSNGKEYLKVTFRSDKHDADFTDNFYTTLKALPKLMDLITGFTGDKPAGEFSTSDVPALIVGRSANAIVDDVARTNEKDGKVYTNYYPTLRFRDFASQTKEWVDTDARTIDETAPKAVTEAATSTVTLIDNTSLPF